MDSEEKRIEDTGIKDGQKCPCCERVAVMSPRVAGVFVYAPFFELPYPCIPAEFYRVCFAEWHDEDKRRHCCESLLLFVKRTIDAHPTAREAATCWTAATIVFADPDQSPLTIRKNNPAPMMLA